MKDLLLDTVFTFLKEHYDVSKPVLLALSGGPDSLALLYSTLLCLDKLTLKIAIGHVDHGWRQESQHEALHLQELVQNLGLTFHLKTISPNKLKGSMEEGAREERLKFFSELCSTYGYQAVMLAHHRNDQAETVLKRILEGAGFANSLGMMPATFHSERSLNLWRPFLELPKDVLVTWLESRKHKFFTDRTNLDAQFLRGRMRTDMLPQLRASFGKEIEQNLCILGKESQEIHALLMKNLLSFLKAIETSQTGSFLDLSTCCPFLPIESRFIIRHLCMMQGCRPNRSILEAAASHLLAGSGNKFFYIDKGILVVDRKRLFVMPKRVRESPLERTKLQHGRKWGAWSIEVQPFESSAHGKCSDWHSAWKGETETILPEGIYELGLPEMSASYPRSSPISKWWNNHKIPAFLRREVPVLWQGNKIVHEFLTGRSFFDAASDRNLVKIKLKKKEKEDF